MSWKDKAIKKLEAERIAAKYDRYAKIMERGVCEALADFCRQDGKFAQAVVQGGTFEDCMKAVAKDCKTGISDQEAFRRAARQWRGDDFVFAQAKESGGSLCDHAADRRAEL